jgi:hypothetical protein
MTTTKAGKNAVVTLSTGVSLSTQHSTSELEAQLDGGSGASEIAPSTTGHQYVGLTLTNGTVQVVDLSTITSVAGS